MSDLELNDAVHVIRDSGANLEGIVAFVGNVAFAEGEGDWVGVRLTGSSAGKGKNDGSVQSQRYFKCPENCGLFVRPLSLQKRRLTRLEELRLRRELASSGISSVAGTTTPARAPTAASMTPPRSTAGSGTTTPAGRQSRLDELRQRREAIVNERETSSVQEANQQLIDDLKKQLKEKDEALLAVNETLSRAEKELSTAKEDAKNLSSEKDDLLQALKDQPPPASSGGNDPTSEPPPVTNTWAREQQMLENEVMKLEEKNQILTKQMEKQKSEHSTEVTQLRSESLAYKNELQALTEQTQQRGVSDTSHYKEKAKLQAQIAALTREVQDMKNEKVDLESTVEDLALDKDHIQEQYEGLSEKFDEMKIDFETSQMEIEEVRMELEEAKAAAEKVGSAAEMSVAAAATGTSVAASSTESDDMAQALSIQNARLREALIRLREQSSVEKIELTRQMKAMEKESEAANSKIKDSTEMEQLKLKLEEENRELKDMVDQGAAFEGMVEELSDRLMEMEEQNISLSATIRELEESAELTTEMEEVQAEELKAMTRDLEDRETVIRNLEEAIKMQRKREDDFNRTVANYRSTVETLKKSKEALLEMQQGGEGEKSNLLASSQKALARAAQLVSDAADMRKREAQAALDKVEGLSQKYLAERLEKMLPKGVSSLEVSGIKGELLMSRIAGLASSSLDGIASSFDRNLRNVPLDDDVVVDPSQESDSLVLSDESKQDVANMLHQTECAQVLISTGVDAIKHLSTGQWPDLLSEQASTELGSSLGHTMNELEVVLRVLLKSLKEEGVIDTHQSSVDSLRQAASTAQLALQADLMASEIAVPAEWTPPGMQLINHTTRAKFACLGAASAIAASCRNDSLVGVVGSQLRTFLKKLDRLSGEASKACSCLALLDVQKQGDVSTLSSNAELLQAACVGLLAGIREVVLESDSITLDSLKTCDDAAEAVVKLMSQFSSALRSVKLNAEDSGHFHPLSPESIDSWNCTSQLALQLRAVDGDEDDVNFLMRARAIEHRLSEAVDSEPKLLVANSKVNSLEKSLATRSKEIAMQNARLSELEKLLAKSSTKPSPVKMSNVARSSEELHQMKEENRMLMEAMEVLQEQVDGYENEIRMLNTMKSPKKLGNKAGSRRQSLEPKNTPQAGKRQQSQRGLGGASTGFVGDTVVSSAAVGVLEAALFRPALSDARRDAAKWKNAALSQVLLELPPLSVPCSAYGEESKDDFYSDAMDNLTRLTDAVSHFRMKQATISVVDLEKSKGRARAQLRESIAVRDAASRQVETAAAAVQRCLAQYGPSPVHTSSELLRGKVILQGKEPHQTLPANVTTEELHALNLHILS